MRILLPAIAALTFFLSCANDKKEQPGKESQTQKDSAADKTVLAEKGAPSFVGRWKPVEMNLKGITEEDRKDMTTNIILEFTGDGKYFGFNKDKKQEGTYSYDATTKKLSVVNSSNSRENEIFTIGWEDDLLLMTNDEGTVKLKKQ